MPRHISIIGGGFHGICSAYLLAKKGYKVSLIDTGKTLGGVMASVEKDGYIYDLGCHLFDNSYQELANLIKELMSDRIVPHKTIYASILNGITSTDTDNPNLASLGRRVSSDIFFEMVDAILATRKMPASSLADQVEATFGPAAAKALNDVYHKKTRCSFEDLSSTVFDTILPPRLYFLDNEVARFLKKHPDLDKLIAVECMDDPLKLFGNRLDITKTDYRQFYPAERGMRGFCEQAEKKLIDCGVDIYKTTFCQAIDQDGQGCRLTLLDKDTEKSWHMASDLVFWAGDVTKLSEILGGPEDIAAYNQPVPIVVFYFNLPADQIGHYSYINNFDRENLISRISAPSNYGAAMAPKGMGYVCAEVTTRVGSDMWNDSEAQTEAIWQEILAMNFVAPDAHMPEAFILKTPVGYMLKKKGYKKAFQNFTAFAKQTPNIYFPEHGSFSKANIFADVAHIITALDH